MVNEKIRKQVRDELTEYLTLRKHRKTSERYAILDHIYSIDGHFNMDSLYNSMLEANFRVSRSTLYNTIELLLDCGLVVKHQFGANAAQYERAYGNENHDHIICVDCGEVRETRNNLISEAQLKKIRRFKVSYYSMYIYGICSKCSHARRMELNRLRRK
ncbi:MAG: transcriptional repressor [Bacteroidales bacterium]|nr:transcriptional repressor [Bacteroidales bacterium]